MTSPDCRSEAETTFLRWYWLPHIVYNIQRSGNHPVLADAPQAPCRAEPPVVWIFLPHYRLFQRELALGVRAFQP
jgi:hypothetical protein